MKVDFFWEGKYPPFWDISPWVVLTENHTVVCYRERETRERVIEIYNPENGAIHRIPSIYNFILGTYGDNVILGRVTDVRSHLQINRITNYDIINRSIFWSLEEAALVEKFKFRSITKTNLQCYELGNKVLNLTAGEITINQYAGRSQQSWEIGNGMRFFQRGNRLELVSSLQELIWSKDNYLGSWFQGTVGDIVYFLLPNQQLVLIDISSGAEVDRIELQNLKVVTGRAGGCFVIRNDAGFDSSTIVDVLVNEEYVVWVTEQNQIVLNNLRTGQVLQHELNGDFYLMDISGGYIMLNQVEDSENGRLGLIRMEDMGK